MFLEIDIYVIKQKDLSFVSPPTPLGLHYIVLFFRLALKDKSTVSGCDVEQEQNVFN